MGCGQAHRHRSSTVHLTAYPNDVSLILINSRALTLDPLNPGAAAVAIAGERIAAAGSEAHVSGLRGAKTEVIDCKGLPLIPGLHDAHTHVLATAASLSALDCGSPGIDSVGELLNALRNRAAGLPPGQWIRGYGLEPAALREKRYPTRQELDAVTPRHPARLEHSSGHATLLNSQGLAEAKIDSETSDPPDGVIDRDLNGEPTGLLLEMGAYLRERLGRTRSPEEMEAGVAQLSNTLLSYGITSVQDAGPNNGIDQWETFKSLTSRQLFQPRLTMMAGVGRLDEVSEARLSWGSGDDRLRIGHAKIILTCTTGQLMPAPNDLEEVARQAWELGFPIAVHAIEQESVEEIIRVVQTRTSTTGDSRGSASGPINRPGVKDRIEHCAECPPHLMEKLADSGAMVVTQPGFIYWRGDGYLERVQPELLPHLYAIGKMMERQIPVAFGSDSPVIDPNPWPGIYSAVTGMTKAGLRFPWLGEDKASPCNGNNGLTFMQALSAHTLGGAKSEGTAHRKGMIRPGMLADLALLDRPLDEMTGHKILETGSCLTIIGGRAVWRRGEF